MTPISYLMGEAKRRRKKGSTEHYELIQRGRREFYDEGVGLGDQSAILRLELFAASFFRNT